MRHLDLFSGIGGFALATEMVWDDMEHVFCDNEPFAQEVLKKHWPNSEIYGDIRTLTADPEYNGGAQPKTIGKHRKNEQEAPEGQVKAIHEPKGENLLRGKRLGWQPDILTGGFPCQPFSQAGRRRGTADDRHLWPEMLRVIREFNPRWVVGENVGGLVTWDGGMVLEQIHLDLEAEGYEVQAFIIPAVAKNAPHRRDRVWIVANRAGIGERRRDDKESGDEQNGKLVEEKSGRNSTRNKSKGCSRESSWNQNWAEVAARLCRVDDGLPKRLDRNPRLKALGNAIVPQVAAEIFKAIYLLEQGLTPKTLE